MIGTLALFVLNTALAQTTPSDDVFVSPLRKMDCGSAMIAFRQGEDLLVLNGQDLTIQWSDNGTDGVTDDGDIEGGHHLQVFKDGSARFNDQACVDRSAI